jgi:hypothetical protein
MTVALRPPPAFRFELVSHRFTIDVPPGYRLLDESQGLPSSL